MKTITLYLWHAFHAWRLNRIAAKAALKMRWGDTPEKRRAAAKVNISEGAESNRHEAARDKHMATIKGWIKHITFWR